MLKGDWPPRAMVGSGLAAVEAAEGISHRGLIVKQIRTPFHENQYLAHVRAMTQRGPETVRALTRPYRLIIGVYLRRG
jgi:hypothetical protein